MGEGRRTQAERRAASRTALLAATLSLVAQGEAFEALTIRQVAAAAELAPSGFYRYFADMAELESAALDEAFLRIGRIAGRLADPDGGKVAVSALLAQERVALAFVARQRIAGGLPVRRRIRGEIGGIAEAVAVRLGAAPPMSRWPEPDRLMVATMLVTVVVQAVDRYLTAADPPTGAVAAEISGGIDDAVRRQWRFVMVGARAWRPVLTQY